MYKNKTKKISMIRSNLSVLCRLCLSNNESIVDIFTFSSKVNRKISHLIMECVSVHITEEDELPKCICQRCYIQLERVHEFQMRAVKSDRMLRQYVQQWHATAGEIEIPSLECSSEHDSSNNINLLDDKAGPKLKKETSDRNGEEESLSSKTKKIWLKNQELLKSDGTDQLDIKLETENYSTATSLFIDDESVLKDTTLLQIDNSNQLNIKLKPISQDNEHLKEDRLLIDDGAELTSGDTEKSVKSLESISNASSLMNKKMKINRNDKCISSNRLKFHHKGDISYQCDVCTKHFTNACYLKQHKLVHTAVKSYLCDICSKSFRLLHHLNRHKLLHTGEKPYQCDVCNKRFADWANLKTHKLLHTGEKSHQCEVCSKCFSKSSHLRRHATLHTGEKPYQCAICNKCFSQSSHLKRHKLIHTGEKSFECDVCKKSFSYSSGLKTHQLLHSGDKRHWCDVCDKQFFRIDQLKSHKRLHTGEKPHQCNVCNRGFAHLNGLKYHKRLH